MTPLQEVRAAHKRLTELYDASTHGTWEAHPRDQEVNARMADGMYSAVCDWYKSASSDGDLIVTLHRTIAAQMALLEERIRLAETTQYWQNPDATLEPFSIKPDAKTLALARAINGGTDA